MNIPYVVSNDIALSLRQWGSKQGFCIPEETFFQQLRGDFHSVMQSIFSTVEIVEEDEMIQGIQGLLSEGGPTLSLDRNYCQQSNYYLDLTRQVSKNGSGFVDTGLGQRPNAPAVSIQIEQLQEDRVQRVVLVDDVIFSGGVIEEVILMLATAGIDVAYVAAGIAIREGIERVSRLGKEVRAVRVYNQVVDEVCERDFYPGVPCSGRTLSGGSNIGVPYILPYGLPTQWASIPEQAAKCFSRFCLEQTITLFEEVEKLSQREVLCEDLERKLCLHRTGRFVDWLVRDLQRI